MNPIKMEVGGVYRRSDGATCLCTGNVSWGKNDTYPWLVDGVYYSDDGPCASGTWNLIARIDQPCEQGCVSTQPTPTPETHELEGYTSGGPSGLELRRASLDMAIRCAWAETTHRYRVLRCKTTGLHSLDPIPLDMEEDDWDKEAGPKVTRAIVCYLYEHTFLSHKADSLGNALAYIAGPHRELCSATVLYDDGTTRVLTPEQARAEASQHSVLSEEAGR